MSEVNLGRVQGGGIFYSTASSGTSIAKSTLTPTGLVPLVGDCVIFPNGDLRKITAVSSSDVTCGDVAASFKGEKGDTGTTSSIVKTAAEWESQNPVLGAGVFGYDSTNGITKTGDGTTAWADLKAFQTVSSVPEQVAFCDATPEQIEAIASAGLASEYFDVGDEADIELTSGETITVVILDFGKDDLADGSGKAAISIGMKNLLATKYRMNASSSNSGGWNSSEMRTSTMNTLFNLLPAGWKNIIKTVNKKATAGSQSTTIKTSADKLWLFALAELGSASALENCSYDGIKNNAATYKQEGSQYAYFANTVGNADIYENCSALVKKLSNGSGSADYWWLRSPTLGNSTYFWFVRASGDVGNNYASYAYGVSFGFCV